MTTETGTSNPEYTTEDQTAITAIEIANTQAAEIAADLQRVAEAARAAQARYGENHHFEELDDDDHVPYNWSTNNQANQAAEDALAASSVLHDNTQILPISAADLLRFRWKMLNGINAPDPKVGSIPKHDIHLAIDLVNEMEKIDGGLNIKVVPDNYFNDSIVPVPHSVMLIYKSMLYNFHMEADKVARWGSAWKLYAIVFFLTTIIGLVTLLVK